MLHAERWAARYGFLRELWAGRSRVIVDPAIEAALRGAKSLPAPLAALLAELVPTGGGGQAWLLAHDVRPGTGRGRAGARVVEFDAFEEVLAEAPWQVAMVDLARNFVDETSLSRFAARARSRIENRLDTRAFRLLTAVAEFADAGRVAVVSTPGEALGGLDLAQFQELVTQHFARARVYALTLARAASVIDCGEVTADEVEDDEDDELGPVPLAFDNSLGEETAFEWLLAVVGPRDAPRGVTLIELPSAPAEAEAPARPERRERPERAREDDEGLRGQLAQARRQLELANIARQSLVEQLDAAQARIDALEDQLAGVASTPPAAAAAGASAPPAAAAAGASAPPVAAAVGASAPPAAAAVGASAPPATPAPAAEEPRRIDVVEAALQSARWELEQLHDELRRVTARPADALERELAGARARLARLPECAQTVAALAERAGEPLAAELLELRERLLELAGDAVSG